jgi:hypothetical protein
MKKFILVLCIAIVGFIYLNWERARIPDLSADLALKISVLGSLPEDPRYEFAFVIEPYGQLADRESIDFAKVRRRFGESFNDDGSVLLVLVKNGQVTGTAEIPRKPIDLSEGPGKYFRNNRVFLTADWLRGQDLNL